MEHSGGMQASLAGRYARALFDLAVEGKTLSVVEASVARVGEALTGSDDLKALVSSPVVSRSVAARAIAATAAALELDALTTKFLGVLATNRRLAKLGDIVRAFASLTAAHRGETSADVTSAHPLSDTQIAALGANLKQRLGRDVTVNLIVDPAILGGLVVKVGSRLVDSSIRTRLNTLANAMKG
ncbi:MAG: F0F1 ATP synthase subunit delta, partial [Sphingopyxis sp.]